MKFDAVKDHEPNYRFCLNHCFLLQRLLNMAMGRSFKFMVGQISVPQPLPMTIVITRLNIRSNTRIRWWL